MKHWVISHEEEEGSGLKQMTKQIASEQKREEEVVLQDKLG
jgi:hypothetical protein